ncbi:uncharacterized protein VDAG_02882 [Verticillium dahliae VdLs.17]|uniref:Uncharacterized protein n=1 Tax=Verticillium dahliae (strain VdLs.17 / ATCC MYA-4575 / FGSC 10137) TaxID=498257 RepID=G2WXA3_VERDV|nr:uncharacterized protein VDAG_02882 [Verticillium dahliae VdLs.17]EGY21358.1 hypothetical protein VDAG_02882 [Verticillium dahliae VdLs.17]KAF3351336.1 Transport protein particle subunit trs85-2 [Verticillium dahliae VDG2]KAH6707356.1 hypothetical protein EV126DRAFT_510919 [Verticillium dahliae]
MAPSQVPAYILGAACIGRGLMAIAKPTEEYAHVGLPLEPVNATPSPSPSPSRDTSIGTASPLMLFKGIREVSYGLTLAGLQWQDNHKAVTTCAAILSAVRLGDGLVVWMCGGGALRYRAWGHWITSGGLLGWVLWRLRG